MDVIAATAFGLHTDAYNRPEDKFVDLASKVFGQSTFGPSVLLSSMNLNDIHYHLSYEARNPVGSDTNQPVE